MVNRTTFHLTVKGVEYAITRNAEGYKVTSLERKTDRFYRAYQIYATPLGRPLRCTCADCHHRQAWCKHLRAVENWYWSQTKKEEQCPTNVESVEVTESTVNSGSSIKLNGPVPAS